MDDEDAEAGTPAGAARIDVVLWRVHVEPRPPGPPVVTPVGSPLFRRTEFLGCFDAFLKPATILTATVRRMAEPLFQVLWDLAFDTEGSGRPADPSRRRPRLALQLETSLALGLVKHRRGHDWSVVTGIPPGSESFTSMVDEAIRQMLRDANIQDP